MIVMVPLLVCLIGLLVYVLAGNAKVVELGRIAFAFGLLVTLWEFGGRVVALAH